MTSRSASIGRLLAGLIAVLALATPAHAETRAAGWGYNGKGELGAGYIGGPSRVPLSLTGVVGIRELQAAGEWSAALLADGTVEAWGGNHLGQLGDGTNLLKINPVRVKLDGPAVQIAAGPEHAIALLANGTVETWGSNVDGEMGNGTTGTGKESCIQLTLCYTPTPTPVPGLSNVVAVDAGGADDAALLANGTVLAWGENRKGQLGDGTTVQKDVPTPVSGLRSVKQVAIGANATLGGHMLALLDNGTVYALGQGGQGQLGTGTVGGSLAPVQVKGLTGVVHVYASYTHSLALLGNGQLYAWGMNNYGATGVRATATCGKLPCVPLPALVPLTEVSSAAAGFNFSIAVSHGRPYSWGRDNYGKLGAGALANRPAPGLVTGLSNVLEVVAGETHALALFAASPVAQPPGPVTQLGMPPAGPAPPPSSAESPPKPSPEPAPEASPESPPAAPAASPEIEVVPGSRSLTVKWQAASSGDSWRIGIRAATNPRGVFVDKVVLAPSARSYTISQLEARPYEIFVQQTRQGPFGRRIVEGTPLA